MAGRGFVRLQALGGAGMSDRGLFSWSFQGGLSVLSMPSLRRDVWVRLWGKKLDDFR